jgi:hypothetical protein
MSDKNRYRAGENMSLQDLIILQDKCEELERQLADSKSVSVLETLKDSTLFKDYNYGEAREVHFAAMEDKEQLIGIAEKHGLPTVIYSLYSLGYKAGKRGQGNDLNDLVCSKCGEFPESRSKLIEALTKIEMYAVKNQDRELEMIAYNALKESR